MTNIVSFRTRSSNKNRKQSAGESVLLASLSRGLDLLGQASNDWSLHTDDLFAESR
jgi:hypothetical protein